jgi:hypothetical protein
VFQLFQPIGGVGARPLNFSAKTQTGNTKINSNAKRFIFPAPLTISRVFYFLRFDDYIAPFLLCLYPLRPNLPHGATGKNRQHRIKKAVRTSFFQQRKACLPKMADKMHNMDIKGEKGLIFEGVCAKMAINLREMVFAFWLAGRRI